MTSSNRISITTEELEPGELYKLLIGTVIPRPIAWVTTTDIKGTLNLAPFSFFGIVSRKPTLISLTITPDDDSALITNKDTLNNIRSTKEFVVNVVPEDLVEQMNLTSFEFDSNVDEFQKAKLKNTSSAQVTPPSVKESPISMECILDRIIQIGDDYLVIGKVLVFNINREIYLEDYKIDYKKWKPLARIGREYANLSNIFDINN